MGIATDPASSGSKFPRRPRGRGSRAVHTLLTVSRLLCGRQPDVGDPRGPTVALLKSVFPSSGIQDPSQFHSRPHTLPALGGAHPTAGPDLREGRHSAPVWEELK